jgi:pimeloyl-ACP methyl ester carboxylesterase
MSAHSGAEGGLPEDGGDLARRTLAAAIREVWPLAPPAGPLPDPTPAEGPDPYGEPDPEWLRIDWRRHLRTVEVPTPGYPQRPPHSDPAEEPPPGAAASTSVSCVDIGPLDQPASDLAVLFVHGLSGCWQNWLENIPHFARAHRVVALDLPGAGRSPLPEWSISIETYGRFLRDFGDAIGISDCAAVGNSMGGFISAEAAIASPGRFEKLVLVSAAGISHARMRREPAETAARFGVALTPMAFQFQETALRRPRMRSLAFRQLFNHPDRLRGELIYEFVHNGIGRPAFVPAVRALFSYDFLDRLIEVDVPTLIVWGRNDRIVPASDARGYGERLRNSRTVIFDETGHAPMAERPVRFNRVLEHFLSEEGGASS